MKATTSLALGVLLACVAGVADAQMVDAGRAPSRSGEGIAKPLICFSIFLFPHFGQVGSRSCCIRFDRKLKITRHFGQANS